MEKLALPHPLAEIAKVRTHLDTREFATAFCSEPQTVRKNYCLTGGCYGIRPVKAGNKLLWPVAAVVAKLQGGAQ